jgi:hypothetical protein
VTTRPGLLFQNAKFTNNGSLSINMSLSSNQYHIIEFKGTPGGNDTIILNGTNTFANTVVSGTRYLFYSNVGKNVSIGGAGITLGSSSAGINFGLLKFIGAGSTITFETGLNIQQYTNNTAGSNYQNVYLESNNVTFNNYGSVTTTPADAQGANACIVMDINPANGNTISFNNYGTFTSYNNGIGIQMACKSATGTPASINVTNAGVLNMDMPSASEVLLLKNATNVSITNSGNISLKAGTNAFKSQANLELSQVINNTGTVTVTGGSLMGDITAPAVAPVLNNNTNGVVNFNYGVAAGTTPATAGTVTVNNAGGTIAGSCTFAAGTLNTANGTLSPGDNGTGIGKMILTPVGGAFTLSGNVTAQVNGKTTAGTDFDQIAFAEACALTLTDAIALTVTKGGTYAQMTDDRISLIGSTSVTGTFAAPSLPAEWVVNYTGGDVAIVSLGGTGVTNPLSGLTKVYVSANQLHVNIEKAGGAVVEFMDMTGRMVKSVSVQGTENTIPISNLKGVYMIRVKCQTLNDCYKIIL